MMLRRGAAITLLALLPAAVVAVAQAASSPAPQASARTPQLTADAVAVQPGDALTLQGRGYPRNAHLALVAGPPGAQAERIGGARTGQRGSFVATIRVRPHAAPGTVVASACSDACRVKASVRFRIVAP